MAHRIFHSLYVLILVLTQFATGVSPALAAQPANDDFANAETIQAFPFQVTVDTTDGSHEPDETSNCAFPSRSVWYSFTPAQDTALHLDMLGSEVGGIVDIFLASGSTISDLTSLGCVTRENSINMIFNAGQSYYLRMDSYEGQPGILQLNIEQLTPPDNDNFANAESIPSLPFSASVDNTQATPEAGEPQNCNFPFRSVWYSFTPAQDMAIRVNPVGAVVGVFLASGPGLSDLNFFGCAFDNFAGQFQVDAGITYYFRLDSSGQAGILQLNIEQILAPDNDRFDSAQSINSFPFNATLDNTNASAEFGESSSCSSPFRSLWYTFTPAQKMVLSVGISSSSQGGAAASLFLASGPTAADLLSLACVYTPSPIQYELEGGRTYYLRIDSFGMPDLLNLNIELITPPANDSFVDAEAFGALPFNVTLSNTNASAELGEPQYCSYPYRSVWYSFVPAQDMVIQVSSSSEGTVSIFLAARPAIGDLEGVACAYSGNASNLQVQAGDVYYFRLDSPGQAGSHELSVQEISPPTNDDFADAESIGSLPFSPSIDYSHATAEANEPWICAYPNRSVWYAFTPADDMAVRLSSPSEGTVDVFLASGPAFSDLTPIGCTAYGNASNFRFEAGQTYYLRVDSFAMPPVILEFTLEQIFPPANDDLANPSPIGNLPFTTTVDNSSATFEAGEPLGCDALGQSVWYSFIPSESMQVRINTAGSMTSGNVSVYLAAGPGFSDLTFLTCAGSDSTYLPVEAGKTYYLQLDAFGLGGTLQLNLEKLNPPANDNFASAEVITGPPFHASVDITDATLESFEPQPCFYMPNTVWYSFTPTETMTLRADTLGSSINGNVHIYRKTGSGFAGLQFLKCSGPWSSPSFVAEAGQTYYLQVGSSSGQTGSVNINLVQPVPPSNDNLSSAAEITSLPYNAEIDITDATSEPEEPQYCYPLPNTVWYSFTPSDTVKVAASVQANILNPIVSIFHATGSGNGFQDLAFVTCTEFNGARSFLAQAGETYYIQVGSTGLAGSIQFDLSVVPVISGRITDAMTGLPVPGDVPPYATAHLYRICGEDCLEFVNSKPADGEGRFLFDNDFSAQPLTAGSYQVTVTAYPYITGQFGPFEFSGSNLDMGDLPLTPPSTIRGRVVDAKTGAPIPGTYLVLRRCEAGDCTELANEQFADIEGRFLFNTFYNSDPLTGGIYALEITNARYYAKQLQVSVAGGEIRDLGDVMLDPIPPLGSISGRMLDAVTGMPIEAEFIPSVTLYRCDGDICQPVSYQEPGSDGRFRFETDYEGRPLIIGSYQLFANANQYETAQVDNLDVAEDEDQDVGDILLHSAPVRFSDPQTCSEIPASGGDCAFSVKVWNGMAKSLAGKVWVMADASLPESFATYTNFQVGNAQELELEAGKDQVFHFSYSVPANPGSYGTFICTRLYAGEGPQAYLNPIGFKYLFCVYRSASGFVILSPEEVSSSVPIQPGVTETEIEPNNLCTSPQEIGPLPGSFAVHGDLDTSTGLDVDFFRFNAVPGQPVSIDLEGEATGNGTLGDPYLGAFGSDCSLIDANDDYGSLNSHLDITVPEDGTFIVAATSYGDWGFTGGGPGTYQLTLVPEFMIGSISGQATDAANGNPLPGDVAPFAYVHLQNCGGPFGCNDVNAQYAGSDGSFTFSTDFDGKPLWSGEYMIVVEADQYQATSTETFSVGKDEHYNAGRIAVTSHPVRFSDLQTCSIPSAGGQCDFSVRVTNGLATKFSGKAWSNIDAYLLGSPVDFSNFQTDALRNLSLDPGKSTVLRFRFMVRGSVPDGAVMCATALVGRNPSPLFNTVGEKHLFCVTKGSTGFTLTSGQQTQSHVHQMELLKTFKPNPHPSRK